MSTHTSNERVQSLEQQARDIEPMLKQAGCPLPLSVIAAVIGALDTMYGPPAPETRERLASWRHTAMCASWRNESPEPACTCGARERCEAERSSQKAFE